MSDNLRDRIAAAVRVCLASEMEEVWETDDGAWLSVKGLVNGYELADAVIAELGLKRESPQLRPNGANSYRYVTDWKDTMMTDDKAQKKLWETAVADQKLRVTAHIHDTLWDDGPPNTVQVWEGTKAEVEAQAAAYGQARVDEGNLFVSMVIAAVEVAGD